MHDLFGTGLIAFAAFMIIFLVYITSCPMPEERDDTEKDLNKLWQDLRDQALEVSLLVSKDCPDNVEAHRLVLVAATCLIFPRNGTSGIDGTGRGGRAIVTTKMVADRYREGLSALAEAKRFCEVAVAPAVVAVASAVESVESEAAEDATSLSAEHAQLDAVEPETSSVPVESAMPESERKA